MLGKANQYGLIGRLHAASDPHAPFDPRLDGFTECSRAIDFFIPTTVHADALRAVSLNQKHEEYQDSLRGGRNQ